MSSTSESLSRTDHLDQDHRAKVEHQGEKINRKRTGSRHTYLSCALCGFWNRKSNTTKKQPQYATQEPWLGIFPKLILRFITLGILATVLYLGASGTSWGLSDINLDNILVLSTDIQLVTLGLVNKILDYLVTVCIHHTAVASITKWMMLPDNPPSGDAVRIEDFDLEGELSKPWVAVSKFLSRVRSSYSSSSKRKLMTFARFILCLATSVSTLLLGASVNAIGMPKSRWYPDPNYVPENDTIFFFTSPLARIGNVDFMNIWQESWEMSREVGDPSWALTNALAAVDTFVALGNLYSTVSGKNRSNPGWYPVYSSDPYRLTAVNVTAEPGAAVQTMSFQAGVVQDMYNGQRENSTQSWPSKSVGWNANLNLTVPILNTTCTADKETNLEQGALKAEVPSTSSNMTIYILIGPSTNFSGARCAVEIRQGYFPICSWFYLSGPTNGFSVNSYGQMMNPNIAFLNALESDTSITTILANFFNTIVPVLSGLLIGPMDSTAYSLQLASIIASDQGSQLDGLAAVYGMLMSELITAAEWTVTTSPTEMVTQGPVRYYLYGSGPRLPWEWAIVIVIGIIIAIVCWDIRIGSNGQLGLPTEREEELRFFVRQTGNPDEETAVRLVSDRDLAGLQNVQTLQRGVKYGG
ncbi:hypothetical protein V8E54_009538 [Elaphomyces granulatus]